eukprot:CAMPEP_0198502368 /NCGR_PEP_ID=MMETSP1462-20131121/9273_1 /TAXON_ID=1333877 /ORGANISM="Brandtodinium nutriculum, Strain RCC3387" /LENGTH=44 /DNA_ID= /DNA_START= /DNA_END= /DNA_ORIENTATION=
MWARAPPTPATATWMAHLCAAFTTSLNSSSAVYAACASAGFTEL